MSLSSLSFRLRTGNVGLRHGIKIQKYLLVPLLPLIASYYLSIVTPGLRAAGAFRPANYG